MEEDGKLHYAKLAAKKIINKDYYVEIEETRTYTSKPSKKKIT